MIQNKGFVKYKYIKSLLLTTEIKMLLHIYAMIKVLKSILKIIQQIFLNMKKERVKGKMVQSILLMLMKKMQFQVFTSEKIDKNEKNIFFKFSIVVIFLLM